MIHIKCESLFLQNIIYKIMIKALRVNADMLDPVGVYL